MPEIMADDPMKDANEGPVAFDGTPAAPASSAGALPPRPAAVRPAAPEAPPVFAVPTPQPPVPPSAQALDLPPPPGSALDAPIMAPQQSRTPTPAPPAAPSAPADASGLQSDIAKILQDVKLPERRGNTAPEAAKRVFDTGLATDAPAGTAPAAPSAPAPAPTPAPVLQQGAPLPTGAGANAGQAPAQKDDVVPVRTLKDDLRSVVHVQKMSLVKAASLEQDRKQRQDDVARVAKTQRSQRIFGIVFSSLVLLALGGAALGGVYFIMSQRAGMVVQPPTSSILFAESAVALPLSGQSPKALKGTIATARTTSGTLGSITRIVPILPDDAAIAAGQIDASRPATFSEFMRSIGATVPDELLRALGDDFFFGIHTVDENVPILIVPVASYAHAFAGMLAWEKTMNLDLSPAFTPVPSIAKDERGLPVQRTFSDLVMRNYDVRALKDDGGTIRLYYSFPTQGMLVIAESPYSFAEILSRLQAQRKL